MGSVVRADEFIACVKLLQAAFSDFHNIVEELIAEGDTVVARLTYRGTHRGELFGVPKSTPKHTNCPGPELR